MRTQRQQFVQRRQFLKAAGICVALPVLEWTHPSYADSDSAAPQRMVAVNIPLGFYGPDFFPEKTGREFELPATLKPAESIRDHFSVISGCSHPDVDGGHAAEVSFLTAAPHPGSRSFQNSISFDQVLAKSIGDKTRVASLVLGERSASWNANGVAIPSENHPEQAYRRLFIKGSPDEVARVEQRLDNGHSILDVLTDEAKSLNHRISQVDRSKLDQYFTAVREVEQRLKQAEVWSRKPLPKVEEPCPKPIPSEDVTARLASFFQLVRLALMTDTTRIVTLCGHGGSLVPPIPGVNKGYHALTHHGKTAEMVDQLKKIDVETIRVWSEFIISLQQTEEAGGSLLDRTQVFMGSNLGNANAHTTTNLPILLAGGRYRHGQHLAFDKSNNTPMANLFVTMAQSMGLPVEQFASSTGTISQLQT